MVFDFSDYGTPPIHRTQPLFNILLTLEEIREYYIEHTEVEEFCLLNSDHLGLATIYSGLANVLYSITDDGKMLALIPESLGYTRFDTNMETTPTGYGTNYGKLVIEW